MTRSHVRPWAILLLAFVLASCARPDPATQSEQTPETAARAAFDQYVDAFWSKGDAAAIERAMAPTMTYHYNGMTRSSDHQQHRDQLHGFRGQFPDLSAVTDAYTGSGAYGAAATTWTGTYSGTVCGKKSTEPSTWRVNYVFRVEDGRIVELWETWDEGGLLKQLGVGPGACDA